MHSRIGVWESGFDDAFWEGWTTVVPSSRQYNSPCRAEAIRSRASVVSDGSPMASPLRSQRR